MMPGRPMRRPGPDKPSGSRHAAGRRIFEVQHLAGMDPREGGMGRGRGLRKAREDQLELAGIGRDVADREDAGPAGRRRRGIDTDMVARSEEHTSELQSRRDLVCRLLLEKKKKKKR